MLEHILHIFLTAVLGPESSAVKEAKASIPHVRLECFMGKNRIFNGYVLGDIAITVGKHNIMAHKFRNRLTGRINTVYASTCNIIEEG